MTLFQSLVAVIQGLRLCFANPDIRKLAVIPWMIGFASFALLGSAGIYFFSDFVGLFQIDAPSGFLSYAWYYVKVSLIALTLILSLSMLSVVLVLVLAGPFQTAIAAKVLQLSGVKVPEEEAGVRALAGSVARTMVIETGKLLWLVPLGVLVFFIGLFPPFLPVAFLLGAWLLAYQFIDIPLDVLQLSLRKRFSYSWRHKLYLLGFGAALTLFWAVPFLGLFLAPAAAAGAAWLVAQEQTRALE